MDTSDRLLFAFMAAVAAAYLLGWIWTVRTRRSVSSLVSGWVSSSSRGVLVGDAAPLDQVLREVAPGIPGAVIADGGLRFVHRGLHGRLDLISDKTEIQVRTGSLVGQVVEVVPIGFPMSLIAAGGGRSGSGRAAARPSTTASSVAPQTNRCSSRSASRMISA